MKFPRLYAYLGALLVINSVGCREIEGIECDISDGTQRFEAKSDLGVAMTTSTGLNIEFPYYKDTRTLDPILKEHVSRLILT